MAALFILTSGHYAPRPVFATHIGGADYILLDMDTAGNTATSVGPFQPCAQVIRNGVQDADEDAVDSIAADIVTGASGIPAVSSYSGGPPFTGAIAFSAGFSYTPGAFSIVASDHNFFLASNPSSSILNVSTALPDSDGKWIMGFVDIEDPVGETGPGTLARLTLSALAGPPAGVYTISLEATAHVDGNNEVQLPDNAVNLDGDYALEDVPESRIAIDVPCPPSVDLQITTFTVDSPPNPLTAGITVPLSVSVAVRNAGSQPVSAARVGVVIDETPVLTAGNTVLGDCGPQRITLGPFDLPAGAVLTLPPQNVSLTCTSSTTLFGTLKADIGVSGAVSLPYPLVDPNPSNNLRSAAFYDIVVKHDSDRDGVFNDADECPATPAQQTVDSSGCAALQVDADSDGLCDPGAPSAGPESCTGTDACPNSLRGYPVDVFGCADLDVDPDSDGICSPGAPSAGPSGCTGVDNCPNVPNPGQEDTDGYGISDACESQPPIAVGGMLVLLALDSGAPRSPDVGTVPIYVVWPAAVALGLAVVSLPVLRLRRMRR